MTPAFGCAGVPTLDSHPIGQEVAVEITSAGDAGGDRVRGDRPDASILVGEIIPGEVARAREGFSALKDRRTELYRRLEEERG